MFGFGVMSLRRREYEAYLATLSREAGANVPNRIAKMISDSLRLGK